MIKQSNFILKCNIKLIMVFTFVATFITSCSDGYKPDPTEYDLLHITGQIVDIDENPIPDISVELATRDTVFTLWVLQSYDTTQIRNFLTDSNGAIDMLVDRQELTRSFLHCNNIPDLFNEKYSTHSVVFDPEEILDDNIDVQIVLNPLVTLTVVNNSMYLVDYEIKGDHIRDIYGVVNHSLYQTISVGHSVVHNLGVGQEVTLTYDLVDTTFMLTEESITYEIN